MVVEIGSLNVRVESGSVLSRVQAVADRGNGTPAKVLLPKAIAGGIDADALEEIMVDGEALASNRIKMTREGDVVVKLTTPYDAAYITEEFAGLVVPSHCVLIRDLHPAEIDARYLAYVLSSPYGKV